MIEIFFGLVPRPSTCPTRVARSLQVASMFLLAVIAACGTNPSESNTSANLLPVPTSSWRPGDPALNALAMGTLEGGHQGSRYCVWLSIKSSRVPVVWPAGYHIRLHPLELLNSRDAVVATGGEQIRVGGGFSRAKPSSKCMLGQKDAFYVMSGVPAAPGK